MALDPEALLQRLEVGVGAVHFGRVEGVMAVAEHLWPTTRIEVEQGFQQGLFGVGGCQLHHRALLKQVAHAADFAQLAAVFVEGQAQFGGGAVAVVGEGLHQHSHATGAIALVAHRLELCPVALALT